MPDDKELLRCYARDRAESAFATLVQRHLPLVYTAALRRVNGNEALAQDVAQAVFVALAREAPRLLGHEVLAGWLYVTTRHAAANAMRSEQRRQHREREAWAMHDNMELTEANWDRLRPELDAVMDDLDPTERDAVLLRYFEGRPYAEIGSRLGTTEDAARRRVDRALDKLRDLLARRGVTSTATALAGLLSANSVLGAPAGLAGVVTASALAGGAAAASVGFIAFMATNKLILGLAGATLLAGGAAVFQYQEAHRIAGELQTAREVQATLQARLEREQELARAAREARQTTAQVASVAPRTSGAADGGRPAAATTPATSRARAMSPFARMNILFANPEYVQLQAKHFALSLPQQYGLLYHKLRLTPEAIMQFEDLLMESHQASTDRMVAARAEGVSLDDPVLRQLKDPVAGEIEQKIKTLLGPEGYAAYQAYSSRGQATARSATDSLASSLYLTDTPLTGDQASKLVELIAENAPKPAPAEQSKTMPVIASPNWEEIYARAAEILSPRQMAALQISNERTQILREMGELQNKLLQEAAVAAPSPGGG